jgi:hypothetical protein
VPKGPIATYKIQQFVEFSNFIRVRASGETLEDWKPCTSKKRRQHSNSRSNGAKGIHSHIALVNALPRMRLKSVDSHKHVHHLKN